MNNELAKILKSIMGAFFCALGINLFIIPVGLYTGGVMGIGQLIRTVLVEYVGLDFGGIDISGIITYILNIPLFALAFFKVSRKFFIKTVITVTFQTVFLTIIPTNIQILKGDILSSVIIGGVISGYGLGLILSQGSSAGGQDIVGVYMMQKSNTISVGKTSIFVNSFVYTICLIMYDLKTVIYSLIFIFVLSNVTDKMHLQNVKIKACIITNEPEKVREVIEKFGRSSTIYQATGGYTGKEFKVVNTLLSKYEKRMVKHELEVRNLAVFADFTQVVDTLGHFPKNLYIN